MASLTNICLYFFAILCLFSGVASNAVAVSYHVSTATELQNALNEAASSDELDWILIEKGTYHGNFVYNSTSSRGLYIWGGWSSDFITRETDPSNTVLDGGSAGPCLVINAPDVSTTYSIRGLTFRNGNGSTSAGGLHLASNTVFTVSHCQIIDNVSSASAGGIHISGSYGNLYDIVLSGNTGPTGGAHLSGTDYVFFEASEVTHNTGHSRGGGLRIEAPHIKVSDSRIENNQADEGGGIFAKGEQIEIYHNRIQHNSAENGFGGGGVWAVGGTTAINIKYNDIGYNRVETIGSGYGGGLLIQGGTFEIANNSITHNRSNSDGGGIYTGDGAGGTFVNNIIAHNDGADGGGIYVHTNAEVNLINNTICYNTLLSVGTGMRGGGIHLQLQGDNSIANIYNNIIWNNEATTANDIYLVNDNNSVPIPVNVFHNNFNLSGDGTYIEIPFPIHTSNLNHVDPLFVDPGNDDFHLSGNSPCIDAGTSVNAPDNDFDDLPRPMRYTFDMGAHEALFLGDVSGDGVTDLSDAIRVLQILAGVTSTSVVKNETAQVNEDGQTGLAEAIYILRWVAGLYNRPPVLAPIGNREIEEGATLEFTLSASDAEGDDLTFSATGLPVGAVLHPGTGAFRWTPEYTQSGAYTVTFTVSDVYENTDSNTIVITVIDSRSVENWDFILNGGQGHGTLTFARESDGSITGDGNWAYTYSGAEITGIFADALVTSTDQSFSITATGTATNPFAPPGYQTSPFTLTIQATRNNGDASGTYSITFTTFGWPSSISGTFQATRTGTQG